MAGAILRYAHVLVGKERTSGSFDSEAEKSGRRRVLFQFTGHDNKSGFKKKSKSTSIDYDMIIKAIYLSQVTGHRSLVTGHRSQVTGHGDKSGSEKKRKNQIFVKKIDLLES